jgi:hypothetical protein
MEADGVLLAPAVEGWDRIADSSAGHVAALVPCYP